MRGSGTQPISWGGGALWMGAGVVHPRGSRGEVLEEAGEAAYRDGTRALGDVTSLCLPRAITPLHIPSMRATGCSDKIIFAGSASGDVHVLCVLGAGHKMRLTLIGAVRCPRESMGRVLLVEALSVSMCAGICVF